MTVQRCAYADLYKAQRAPTCGCEICKDKWTAEQRLRDIERRLKSVEASS